MSLENLTKRLSKGLRNKALILTGAAIIAGSSILSCKSDERYPPDPKNRVNIDAPYPIWNLDQVDVLNTKQSLVMYSVTLNERPPFYKGDMPLEYDRVETPGRGYLYGSPKILTQEFNDFKNLFVYNGPILNGVVTIDKDRIMVAEGKFSYFAKELEKGVHAQGINLEEFHYDRGQLIFHCNSDINPIDGYKLKEKNVQGKKQKEYYFILPGDI